MGLKMITMLIVPETSINSICNKISSTVQYGTVRYSTVQYSTVQYGTVQYSTIGSLF